MERRKFLAGLIGLPVAVCASAKVETEGKPEPIYRTDSETDSFGGTFSVISRTDMPYYCDKNVFIDARIAKWSKPIKPGSVAYWTRDGRVSNLMGEAAGVVESVHGDIVTMRVHG